MATKIETPQTAAARQAGHPHHTAATRGGRVLHFLRHLVEMLVAMTLGMVLLMPVYRAMMRAFGYDRPTTQLPELSALMMAVTMALPMVAWMRVRGHDWARGAEMAGAMLAPAVVLVVLCVLGLAPHTVLAAGPMIAMVPMMVGVMLYRRREYGG